MHNYSPCFQPVATMACKLLVGTDTDSVGEAMGGEASRPPFFCARSRAPYLRPVFLPVPRSASVSSPDVVPTETDACRIPIVHGENVMLSVQDWPAASTVLTEHVPRRVNSAGLAPPIDSDTRVSVPPPEFETVAIRAALVLPTITPPRSSDAGPSAAAAGATEAAAACETRNVRPPSVRFAERAAPVFTAAT